MPPLPSFDRRFHLTAPGLDATTSLVEVAGDVRSAFGVSHEIVLLVDASMSVFHPTGHDIDGDGVTGRLCETDCAGGLRGLTTDFDDVVFQVEMRAARRLLDLLDPETTRIGMVEFGDRPRVLRRVGSIHQLIEAMDRLSYRSHERSDLIDGIHTSIDLLKRAGSGSAGTSQRSILMLSDGAIHTSLTVFRTGRRRKIYSAPSSLHHGSGGSSHRSKEIRAGFDDYASTAIAHARKTGTRIFTFGVGTESEDAERLLERLATETGGTYVRVDAAANVLLDLPFVNLAGLSHVELVNWTTGEEGRATRVFPDGSFDGYVALAPGANELHVRAFMDKGAPLEASTTVRYHSGAAESDALRGLLLELRARSLETDLARRAQVGRRRARDKSLELRTD